MKIGLFCLLTVFSVLATARGHKVDSKKGDVTTIIEEQPSVQLGSDLCSSETHTLNGKTDFIHVSCQIKTEFATDCVANWDQGKAELFLYKSYSNSDLTESTNERRQLLKNIKISESEFPAAAQNWINLYCQKKDLPKPKVTKTLIEPEHEVPFIMSGSPVNNCRMETELIEGKVKGISTSCGISFNSEDDQNQKINFCMVFVEAKGPNGPFVGGFEKLKNCLHDRTGVLSHKKTVYVLEEVLPVTAKNRAELGAKTAELLQTYCQDSLSSNAEKTGEWSDATYDPAACPQ